MCMFHVIKVVSLYDPDKVTIFPVKFQIFVSLKLVLYFWIYDLYVVHLLRE